MIDRGDQILLDGPHVLVRGAASGQLVQPVGGDRQLRVGFDRVLEELDRRDGISGIAEKASRSA